MPTPSFNLGFTTLHFTDRLVALSVPGGLLFHRHRDRAAHRALAGRRDLERDPRQSAARARGRPQHPRLQADRLRDRRRLCRVRRRPARRAAGLHAARRLHLRHLRPAGDADRDRRHRHAVRAAARRRGLAVPAGLPAIARSGSARPGSWCSASCSCCWSSSCGAASSAASRTSTELVVNRKKPREATEAESLRDFARRCGHRARPKRCAAQARERSDRRTDPAGKRADQALWRPRRQQRHRLHRPPWRAARHHRPERRRQDHLLQDADLRGAADLRHDRVRGPRHHRQERHRRLPARPDQELPDQPALQPTDGAREPDDRGAGGAARQVPARSVPQTRERSRARRAGRADARTGRSGRPRRHAGLGARLWREAAAGDRPRAGHLAEPAAARRAARRHEPAGARRDRQAAQVDQPGPHHDRHRSRHGRAVRTGRAHHGAAGGPRAGRRHAGGNQGQRRGAGSLSRRRGARE